MLLKLKSLICQSADDLSLFSCDKETLFWSKWTALYYESCESLLTFSAGAERLGVLDRELYAGHIGMNYGYMLHNFNLVISYLESADLDVAHTVNESYLNEVSTSFHEESFPLQKVLTSLNVCYSKMFDVALQTPFFEQNNAVSRVSAELIEAVLNSLTTAWSDSCSLSRSSLFESLFLVSSYYLNYHHKLEKHRSLTLQRIIKSEGFRLDSEAILEKNKTLISQYLRQAEIPFFVEEMLLEYWALKMSLVQGLVENHAHGWQYYWTFVTRIVRYFKNSEATTRDEILNNDFDYLHQYFINELGHSDRTFEANKFIRQFKKVHLDKLESVHRMKQAQKPRMALYSSRGSSVKVSSKGTFFNEAAPKIPEHFNIVQGALFWYRFEGGFLPCELILMPRLETSHDCFIFDFDGGKGLLSFRSEEMLAHLESGLLESRLTSNQCHESWMKNVTSEKKTG